MTTKARGTSDAKQLAGIPIQRPVRRTESALKKQFEASNIAKRCVLINSSANCQDQEKSR